MRSAATSERQGLGAGAALALLAAGAAAAGGGALAVGCGGGLLHAVALLPAAARGGVWGGALPVFGVGRFGRHTWVWVKMKPDGPCRV